MVACVVGAIQYYYCHQYTNCSFTLYTLFHYTLAFHRISKNIHKLGSKIDIQLTITQACY